jgi:hypothetical protein
MRPRALAFVIVPLIAAGLVAPPAQAVTQPRVLDLCASAEGLSLDVTSAAGVLLPPVRGKKPKPAGPAKAQALATELVSGVNPCTDPLDEYALGAIADINQLLDAGDLDGALDLLRYYIEGLRPYDPDEGSDVSSRKPGITRQGGVCEGFEKNTLTLPYEVGLGLELAKLASLAGDDDIAADAIQHAQAHAQKWIEGRAEGEATSIPDLLSLANSAALLALDDEVVQALIDEAGAVAVQSYQFYNLLPCRMTKDKLDCFFKAAMAVQLLGDSSISDERMSSDLSQAIETARKIKAGKKPRCTVEKYAFRMMFESTSDRGEKLTFDTGRVVFTVKDGTITSADKGPLILSSVTDAGCWANYGEGWVKEGSADITGGRFPYKVSGTDDGEMLTLVLAHKGRWKITGTGSLGCEFLFQLADMFYNLFPRLLNEGIPLPAGAVGYEESDSGVEFHEPTGQNLPWSSYFEFRLLEPRR